LNPPQNVQVPASLNLCRLDVCLANLGIGISRSKAKQLIETGLVYVNDEKAMRPKQRVKEGDQITVFIPPPKEPKLEPIPIPLKILYEDDCIVVIDKSPGLSVHQGAGLEERTLVHGLLFHFDRLSKGSEPLRPGIVHRLDKDTSGTIVVAKDDWTHSRLADFFKSGLVKKMYVAIVRGQPKELEGEIDFPIGRHPVHRKKMSIVTRSPRSALTRWKIKKYLKGATLLSVRIFTGRTHQIRVHMSAIGHPILGDRTYGGPSVVQIDRERIHIPRHMLHAFELSFPHPKTEKWLSFTAPIPSDMEEIIERLER